MKKIRVTLVFFLYLSAGSSAFALDAMSDDELSKSVGQGEFLSIKNIGTQELGNPNPNVGFTRLTLNSKLELNANINKLRFGCDNSNYTDCDISIDNVSLTGKVPSRRVDAQPNNFPYLGGVAEKLNSTKRLNSQFAKTDDAGAGTDFVMNNPFLEFAIQNPNSLTNRKLVGYRFGAHEAWGTLSTGDGPTNSDGTATTPTIIGPADCSNNACTAFDPNVATRVYGVGEAGLDALYNEIKSLSGDRNEQARLFKDVTKKWVSYSIGQNHTGVNSISGRLPVRLENFNLQARVRDVDFLGIPEAIGETRAEVAIVSGNLNRGDQSDFGRIAGGGSNENGNYDPGYLRNVFLGDTDTVYDPSTYGNYVANQALQGRAPTFKRASRAELSGMIVNVHGTILGGLSDAILGGDRFNNQNIETNLFHQLSFGSGDTYREGQGSKNFAFQYQTLDGLQWITTDKRLSSSYDVYGNPTGNDLGGVTQGYDWLSTRAGWWLESPLATVSDAFVPVGQILNRGAPEANVPIVLGNIDLGQRPIDNCYGGLTFC